MPTLDDKYKILYNEANLERLGRFTESIFMTPNEFFQGLEISRLVVIPVEDDRGVSEVEVRSIFIAHAQTMFIPERLLEGMSLPTVMDGMKSSKEYTYVCAPLHFKTVHGDDSEMKSSIAAAAKEGRGREAEEGKKEEGKKEEGRDRGREAEEEEEGWVRARSRTPPPKCAFSRITNSDGVIQVGYLELFQAVQQMFLPRSLKHREDYARARGNLHADNFREVKSVIDVLNGAMDSGRHNFASKLKPHLEASRESSDPENRKQAILLEREINREDDFYDAGPTIQEGRLSTMTLGGDPYYLEKKASHLKDDEYFNKTVYNVLVTVKVVTRSNMYFIYFYISRRKILDFLRKKEEKKGFSEITERDSISFWIGQAMEFINRPEFIVVIRDIITTSVGQGGAGPRSDSTNKVITDLLPFLDIRVRHGLPADYHCSIDSGCKSFAFVEIKEDSSLINYTQLRVPDLNYLPNDFVVGFDGNVHYMLTRQFTALGKHHWNGIVIRSNGPFQLPAYEDVRIASVIGERDGDSMNSLEVEAPNSLQEVLVDPVAAEAEAKAVAKAAVAAEAKAAVVAEAAAAETRVTPSLICKTIDYVVGMINYFFTSPKIGRSSYDKTFIDELLQNLPIGVSIHTLKPYKFTDDLIEEAVPRDIYSFGGRGCKLLKRTKKQKRGSRRRGSRRRGSRRSRRRGSRRGRKN
jgi:hypothetical protein